jgi:hypothetical protein
MQPGSPTGLPLRQTLDEVQPTDLGPLLHSEQADAAGADDPDRQVAQRRLPRAPEDPGLPIVDLGDGGGRRRSDGHRRSHVGPGVVVSAIGFLVQVVGDGRVSEAELVGDLECALAGEPALGDLRASRATRSA